MNSKQATLLIGGTLLAGGVAGFLYIYSKNKEVKAAAEPSQEVSRELVIKILKDIQREMFGVLTNISMISNQLKEQYRGRLPVHEIKDFLLNGNPKTKEEIKKISDAIYEKYGLEEKDLKYACEVTYQDDKEIRALINDAKTSFDKAFSGTPPDFKAEIPAFLTAELTLNLMKKIMKESLFKIQQFLKSLKDKGITISSQNPQVLMGLQDLKLDDIRLQILNEEGLNKFQESPLKIFQAATQKYAKDDTDSFNLKLSKLEMQNQKAMDALFREPEKATIVIEAIGSHLVKEPEDANNYKNSRAHKAVIAEKKAQNEERDEEEEIEDLNNNIQTLQREVSFQLKTALEDSDFPQELVDSAVNAVFNVFTNYDGKKADTPKAEGVAQENILAKEEEVKVENILAEGNEATVVETHKAEVKEVKDEEGNKTIETVTQDKVVVSTEDATQEIVVQETVVEKVDENNEEN